MRALTALYIRVHEKDAVSLGNKVRILVLEREGYVFEPPKGSLSILQNWLSPFLVDTHDKHILINSVFDRNQALPLEQLSPDDMVNIGQSWLKRKHQSAMSEQQIPPFLKALGYDRDKDTFTRAWRLMFAMLYAEFYNHHEAKLTTTVQQVRMEEVLRHAIEQERTHYWGPYHEKTPEGSLNLGCLTTMISELDPNTILEPGQASDGLSVEHLKAFYGFGDPYALNGAWRVLGRPVNFPKARVLPVMTARVPDLLGEYLVLWCLDECTTGNALKPDGPERIRQLAHDTWHLSPDNFSGFLIRLRQDFPHHAVTNMLAEADVAPRAHTWVNDRIPPLHAFYGLLGAKRTIDANSTSIAPLSLELIMASHNGHTAYVTALLDQGADS